MTALDGHVPVVIVGGGQAGLSLSRLLCDQAIEHLVLERDRVGSTWRTQRWDAFCLVTPNHQCRLPGFSYAGPEPDGFMVRDDVLAFLDAFAASFDPPLHEGVAVTSVAREGPAGFRVVTDHGEVTADQVVLAVGGYHVPTIPRLAERLPDDLAQVHSSAYRSPDALPEGAVLVVGSGQSGAQIAEDLHLAGRRVHLAVGSAPRVARSYRGRDVMTWLEQMGQYDVPVEEHAEGLGARKEANHYVTGRGGGRDIDLRRFALEGMVLHGRLGSVAGGELRFADDLERNLDGADARSARIKATIDAWIAAEGIPAPPEAGYVPPWRPAPGVGAAPLDLEGAGITSVVWATGFRSDWSWVDVPCFDGRGYPTHARGVTTVPGLHVLGLPWLHTWGSGRFAGIERDARHLAGHVVAAASGRGARAVAA